MQTKLFVENDKSEEIKEVPVSVLEVSEFNPRKTRPQDYIQRLADRIKRNGFEITRAPWVYREGDTYYVFAGWTRTQAAKLAGLEKIPVVVHTGFTEEEVVRRADEDNENDEYHEPVPIVDVWLSYKALADMGWTRNQIEDAKNCGKNRYYERIKFAEFPEHVMDKFSQTESLNESHARELLNFTNLGNLSPWITREDAMLYVIEKCEGGIAKDFKREVENVNKVIEKVQTALENLPEQYRQELLENLSNASGLGLSLSVATRAIDAVNRKITIQKRKEEEAQRKALQKAERERIEAERQQKIAQIRTEIMANIVLGDAIQKSKSAPNDIKLVITDPPYGVEFQSNRRVKTEKAEVLENDNEEIFDVLKSVLSNLFDKMQENSVLLCWSSWQYYSRFRSVIKDVGFELKPRPIIWQKPNHSSGDLRGDYAPDTEPIIFAVKGNPKFTEGRKRPTQTQKGSDFLNSNHPTKKPVDLIKNLILNHTEEGQIVVDPFAGSGSVVVASIETKRNFWVCEKSEQWHTEMCDIVLPKVEKMAKEKSYE